MLPVGKRFINVASASSATTNPSRSSSSSTPSSEMVPIGGMAFAGDREIARVEVSTDGGTTWKDARLKNALSPYTWVLWTVDLNVSGNKHYKIVARATDKTGNVQTSEIADPFPNGATGYPVINV